MSKKKYNEEVANWDDLITDLENGHSVAALSKKYGVPKSSLRYKLAKAGKGKDTRFKGEVEAIKEAPEGFFVKGYSTFMDGDGNISRQWVKVDKQGEDKYKLFRDAVENVIERVTPVAPRKFDGFANTDMMTVYSIGDAHIGLLAHHLETGGDHDLRIAEEDLLVAMGMMVKQSLPTSTALVVDVGDFFHADNAANETSAHGNKLDVDGRYAKVLDIGLNLTVELVNKALDKHEKVIWRSAIGNHNEHSAIMMTAFLKAWFRNEPRVEIADTPNMFYYHTFGKNLIGITHGHTIKAEKLGEVMSVDCKEQWSQTDHRYFYTGHIHHQTVKEFTNCVVETFNTLAGKDAWHSSHGYRSKQSMKAITLHKDHGEVTRNTVTLAMVREVKDGGA